MQLGNAITELSTTAIAFAAGIAVHGLKVWFGAEFTPGHNVLGSPGRGEIHSLSVSTRSPSHHNPVFGFLRHLQKSTLHISVC